MIDSESDPQLLIHTRSLGHRQFLSYLQSTPETVQLIYAVEKLLMDTHPFYLNSLLTHLKGRHINTVTQYLRKEQAALTSKNSFLHKINKGIEGRANCLVRIKQKLSKIEETLKLFKQVYHLDKPAEGGRFTRSEGYSPFGVEHQVESAIQTIRALFVDLSRLRDMTIYLVETIHEWRLQLETHAERCKQQVEIQFIHKDTPYFTTIQTDTNFLWSSPLNKYIDLPYHQDPFLVRNIVKLEEKREKQILEKYFVEILYPKDEEVLSRALKCIGMLLFKYEPQIRNYYEEEEQLIETYLRNAVPEESAEQPEYQVGKQGKMSIRGWVFEKPSVGPKQTARQRVTELVQSHQHRMNIIKPFKIANYKEKTSIALAYLSEQHRQLKQQLKRNSMMHSEGEQLDSPMKSERQAQSDTQEAKNTRRMFQSLTKLHDVIEEDPHQIEPDTPKHKTPIKQQKEVVQQQQKEVVQQGQAMEQAMEHSKKHIKINTFLQNAPKKNEFIEVEEEESPINFKQFLQVFRSDTDKPNKERQSRPPIFQKRAKSFSHLPYKGKIINFRKKKMGDQNIGEQKMSEKRQGEAGTKEIKPIMSSLSLKDEYIGLKPKTIPLDLIKSYLEHILSQQFDSNKSFTRYTLKELLFNLQDPFTHSVIFDLMCVEQHIGQAILSERWNTHTNRLTYFLQFIHANTFDRLAHAILRLSEELLAVTPCRQVICSFVVDKMDPISTHFIRLLDQFLSKKAESFGEVRITEKANLCTTSIDLHDRIYSFTSLTHLPKQLTLDAQMMVNYRSLRFQATCLVLTSNFKLRSKHLFKPSATRYRSLALGQLYVRLLIKIITRYHLKQLRTALSSQAGMHPDDPSMGILHSNPFVCSLIHNVAQKARSNQGDEIVRMTRFDSMSSLLNYLSYKRHDQHFQFDFLADSRFILDHELVLAQFQTDLALQFILHSSPHSYLLRNYKHLPIQKLTSKATPLPAYILSTTDEHIRLFLMDGTECLQKHKDVYTYLTMFSRQIHSEMIVTIPEIVLPNLSRHRPAVAPIKLFEGLGRLFIERQFYSTAILTILNHWQNYYPSAVAYTPSANALLFDYPLLLGFYAPKQKEIVACFLLSQKQTNESPR